MKLRSGKNSNTIIPCGKIYQIQHIRRGATLVLRCSMVQYRHDSRRTQNRSANQRLEGGEVSAETRKVMDDYVAGKMSAKEAAEQVYARYGV